MDRRRKKGDTFIKKIVIKIKDKDELKPAIKTNNHNNNENNIKRSPAEDRKKITKILYAEGDSKKISQYKKSEPLNVNTKHKMPVLAKPASVPIKDETKSKAKVLHDSDKDGMSKRFLDLRRIRERYTTKLKVNSNITAKPNEVRREEPMKPVNLKAEEKNVPPVEHLKKISDEIYPTKEIDKINDSRRSSAVTREKRNQSNNKKNPQIKTIMTKNGSMKVYKAVTFVEHKPLTPLEIKIPSDVVRKPMDSIETNSLSKTTVSRVSIKNSDSLGRKSPRKRETRKYRHHLPSRDSARDLYCRTPTTEVARWAPACINKHTKPYYEAWVDTTLAATSKYSVKEKKKFETQTFLKSLRKALDRPFTPELMYSKFDDERYTGRIKITQK